MSKQSLVDKAQNDFEAISLYVLSGENATLNTEQAEMLDRWISAYAILRQHPQKYIATKKLMLKYKDIRLSKSQAELDVNNALKFFNKNNKVERDFLEGWFIDTLTYEISNSGNDIAKAKNLATLQKYLSNTPPIPIDPKLMEKHNINIQINVSGNVINFPEEDLRKLPLHIRERLLNSLPHEITEEGAAEILES